MVVLAVAGVAREALSGWGIKEHPIMKVSDVMTRDVFMARPDETLRQVAARMAEKDVGFLPVRDDECLIGAITDRDIVIRALAAGKDGTALVRDIMTSDVKYCFEDQDMTDIAMNFGANQLRRMPVVDRNKRLVGVITLADEALKDDARMAGGALREVVAHHGGAPGGH